MAFDGDEEDDDYDEESEEEEDVNDDDDEEKETKTTMICMYVCVSTSVRDGKQRRNLDQLNSEVR